MSGYEYANARLRAMKSRLLSRVDFQLFAESGTLEHLLTALTRTDYQESIEAMLVRVGELDVINAALSHNLRVTLRKVCRFFGEPESRLVAIVLQIYDVHNIKTILRGLDNNVSPDEIQGALLPVGEIPDAVLAELTQVSAPRAMMDLSASMRLSVAVPLLQVRSMHPDAELPEFELALDQWYFDRAIAGAKRDGGLLQITLAREADLINLMTVLRLVHAPAERSLYLESFGVDDVRSLFVGHGRVSARTLVQAAAQVSVEAVVGLLADSPYHEALSGGFDAYRRSHRLSDLERSLRRYRLNSCVQLMRKDPLGIGVFLGYVALKVNEIGNLRWIAHSVNMRLPVRHILDELEFSQ